MPAPHGGRRAQLAHLSALLMQDPATTDLYLDVIHTSPQVEPNPDSPKPVVSLYISHTNITFASTTSKRHPARFVLAILFPERDEMTQAEVDELYLELLDTAEVYENTLIKYRIDPAGDGNKPLWHQMIFGGDTRGASQNEMNAGPFTTGYLRDPGKLQAIYLQFFLSINIGVQNP